MRSPIKIGRLEKVPLRDLWAHEAQNLTVWLAENLNLISDEIGINLTFVERERNIGPFFADIVAEDDRQRLVIIENQLERSDHDHLGKLVTYISNLDAGAAVWITPNPREQHKVAVEWLNKYLPEDIYIFLIMIEAFRIGESDVAPKLTVVAGPSSLNKAIGVEQKESATRHIARKAFWTRLLDRAKLQTQLHSSVSPNEDTWLSTGAGISGLTYTYVVNRNTARVEFVIGSSDKSANKKIFDALALHTTEIEARFGGRLEWTRHDESKVSYIRHNIVGGREGEQAQVDEVQDKMIDAMIRLEYSLRPEIDRLREARR